MSAEVILILLIAIVIVDFLLDKILETLNLSRLNAKLPALLEGVYDAEKYQQSINYSKVTTRFGFYTSTFSFAISLFLLLSGGFGIIDSLLRTHISDDTLLTLAYFGLLYIASDIINTPFQLYSTFVIEERFGFNKSTIGLFFMDKLKGYLLSALLGGLILYILLILINYFGTDFWWYFWLVISAFTLFMNMFYTSLILPLFNKLTPLEDGELKQAIEEYSKKVNFPLDNIFVMDGSKRSNKSNAFFSGLGKKKKIVLYDTLIKNQTIDELVAVLAHEAGHYKKKHILWSYVISIAQTGFMLYIISLFIFNENMSLAMGGTQNAIHLNLLAFGILFSPISHFTSLFGNMLSRKNEYEADAYARDTFSGKALADALKKLSVHNLSNLTPHPAYVFMHYSHPTLLQRLEALEK